MKKCLLLFLAALFFCQAVLFAESRPLLPTSLPLPEASNLPTEINVAILMDVPKAVLAIDGPYQIEDQNGRVQFSKPFDGTIRASKNGIDVEGRLYSSSPISILIPAGSVRIEKRHYQNKVMIFWKPGKKLDVVNVIKIEDYVKGVLPLEVHYDWPMEALRAQAVVSRTYALFKAIEKRGEPFQVRNTVISQVYGGPSY